MRLTPLLVIFLGAARLTAATVAPFSLDFSRFGGGSVSGTTLASGLNFPYGMAQLPDGSLVYGQSLPTTPSGLLYGNGPGTTGSVWVQTKLPAGGFAAPQKIVDGLAGIVTDVRTFADGTILVDSGSGGPNTRKLSFFSASGQPKGTASFNFPGSWEHGTGMSLIRQNLDGTATVFFAVGSQADSQKTTATVGLSGLGLASATLNGDSIYQMQVNTAGASVQIVSAPIQVATGFRFAYGLAFDQAGNLLAADNGIDGAHVHDELSADALYRIPAAQLGSSLFDGGFPNSYVDFATGVPVNGDPQATSPVVAFRPVPDTFGMLQSSEGNAGLAYVQPGNLGTGLSGGVLATFHGVFDAGGASNYDNALALYDFSSGTLTPILDAGTATVGHIDSVAVNGNTIYLSDFSQNGLVNSLGGVGQGAVYEFDVPLRTPEPGSWFGATVATAFVIWKAKRARRAARA